MKTTRNKNYSQSQQTRSWLAWISPRTTSGRGSWIFRGIEHGCALKFKNSKGGFETILARIREICKKGNFAKAVVGMVPTGHYWKTFANWLEKQDGIKVVLVNPYAAKQVKELDDNSQKKSDKKDALTIAKLVKDGRYFELFKCPFWQSIPAYIKELPIP